MRSTRISTLFLASFSIALGACGDDDGPGARTCTSRSDCASGQSCVDGTCVTDRSDAGPTPDGAAPDAPGGDLGTGCPTSRMCSGAVCCAETEECVAGFQCLPICANERCGDNDSVCCDAGEVCLDGVVCAASCEADQVVCGATLDVCCASGEVCLDAACVAPGDACTDDFDCLEEGTYCEAALAMPGMSGGGRCLAIPTGTMCEVRPAFDRLALEIEWHWEGVEVDDTLYDNVIASPAVGDVSGDGIPDVVVPVYAGSSLSTTLLVAIHGRTGETLWTIGGSDRPSQVDMVAIGNFDPTDPALEVVYRTAGDALRIVDGDGMTEIARRTSGTAAGGRGAPIVSDLNGDGTPDVVVGCHALNGASIDDAMTDFFDLGACEGNGFGATVVANLDEDPEPEITSGGVAINLDGTYLWRRSGDPHGLPAIADLDLDGDPEIAIVRSGTVVVVDGLDGAMLVGPGGAWADGTFSIAGQGGAPTIADFDADGMPEIATAGSAAYVVYDPDCLETPPRAGGDCAPGTTDFVRWSSETQDLSSSVTGSSVFDFQGDGVSEVIYNDECFLHVYDGVTGADVLEAPFPNSSRTAFEYPLVVDVDRDGNSEIVVTANRDQAVGRDMCPQAYSRVFGVPIAELDPAYAMGTRGVFVLGDPMDRWVRTRPIWNDFAYHVTNVGDLGDSPLVEVDSWTAPGVNSYRQNIQGAGVFNAPNLVVELDAVARCGSRVVRLTAVVRNIGSRGVAPGATVTFSQTMPAPTATVGMATTTTALLPGGNERVTIDVMDVPLEVDLRYEASIDATTATVPATECLTDDNTDAVDERCSGIM